MTSIIFDGVDLSNIDYTPERASNALDWSKVSGKILASRIKKRFIFDNIPYNDGFRNISLDGMYLDRHRYYQDKREQEDIPTLVDYMKMFRATQLLEEREIFTDHFRSVFRKGYPIFTSTHAHINTLKNKIVTHRYGYKDEASSCLDLNDNYWKALICEDTWDPLEKAIYDIFGGEMVTTDLYREGGIVCLVQRGKRLHFITHGTQEPATAQYISWWTQ